MNEKEKPGTLTPQKVTLNPKFISLVKPVLIKNAGQILLMLSLVGCTGAKETFDCAPGHGVGCKSISQVNELENAQEAPIVPALNHETTNLAIQPVFKPYQRPVNLSLPFPKKPFGGAHSAARAPEKLLKVWIAPFEDEDGHLHEASYINALIQESHWAPVKYIEDEAQ